MKNNMADDFDKEKVALRQEFNDLKTRIDQVTSRTLLITMLANAGSLFSRASELGIDFNISELLASAEAKVKFYENEIAQDNNRQDVEKAEEQKRLEEALAEAQKQKAVNEKREAELKQHIAEYTSKPFQKRFDELSKEENDLVKKAANDPNSLTAQEKANLMGQYASEKEKEEAEKKQQELSQCWKKHYAIKHKANESIKYRQGQIKVNEAVINHPSTPEHPRSQAHQDNVVHNQKIVELKEGLKVLTPKEQEREEERRTFLALVNSSQPELAIELLKIHHNRHIDEYDQARQQDPNHQGYHELHSMIIELGGHEKLDLPKPNYPVQEQLVATPQNTKDSLMENKPEPIKHPVEQLVATPQNIKDSSVENKLEPIEHPVEQLVATPQNTKDSAVENKPEPIEHPVARNPKEYAQAIQESLKQSQALPNKASSVGNEEHAQAKGETQSASAKFAQRRKAMMAGHGSR